MRIPTSLLCLALTLALPVPARAQLGFLDGVFKKIDDVNGYAAFGRLTDEDVLRADRMRGFGVEVSFLVAGFGCLPTPNRPCPARGAAPPPPRKHPRCAGGAACEGSIEFRIADSTVKLPYQVKPPPEPDSRFVINAAFGYAQLTGFESAQPGVALRGTIEELPYVGGYIAANLNRLLGGYVGARAGLTRLSGFRGEIPLDAVHTATGTTYLLGGAAGIVVGTDRVQAFLEHSRTYRSFPSVEWSATPGTNRVPLALPRTFKASTAMWNVGVQVSVE